jgi:glucose/arabinose dehydrogenase
MQFCRTALALSLVLSPQLDAQARRAPCDPDNGGITLPAGFCAVVAADEVAITRHIVVARDGTLYSSTQHGLGAISQIPRIDRSKAVSVILALRDTNADGRFDWERRTPMNGRTGIALSPDQRWLYVADSAYVLRLRLAESGEVTSNVDTIVAGMTDDLGHRSKSLAFDERGGLFVSVGSRSNACRASRTETAPDPCPELAVRSGIWRYDANKLRQQHPRDGELWATGVRNAVGLAWNPVARAMYATSHGRDGLHSVWPRLYTLEENAETPTEEFFRVERGVDIGWPYCFHDRRFKQKILAPEYGGDGRTVGRCANMTMPLIGFPGHWGPNALFFYNGTQFPERYRGGAFIAFHGSWNRMPLSEAGYLVAFVPFGGDKPSGPFEIFANGFARDTLEPILARHRPTGFAQAPDGSLYISDDQRGRIWRVYYVGNR